MRHGAAELVWVAGFGAAALWPTASAAACPGRIPPGAYTPSDDANDERLRTRRGQHAAVSQAQRVVFVPHIWSASCARTFRTRRRSRGSRLARPSAGRRTTCFQRCRTSWRTVDPTSSYDRRDATSQHVDQIRRRANMTHDDFSRVGQRARRRAAARRALAVPLLAPPQDERRGRGRLRRRQHRRALRRRAAHLRQRAGRPRRVLAKLAPRSLLIMNDWIPPPICYQRRTAKNGLRGEPVLVSGRARGELRVLGRQGARRPSHRQGPVGVTTPPS